ncbi:MAG: TIGR00725 family protein [Candidatus Zixiibacteriota bacterium]
MLKKKIYIGIIGGSSIGSKIYEIAEKVGHSVAKNRAVLVCGGLSGVMEAASKGAKKNNGTTIGILPENQKRDANDYIDYAIPTGFGIARNMVIINTADVLIAIDGKYGTLSEIALALNSGKKVIALDSKWEDIDGIIKASDPEDAVDKALAIAKTQKGG